MLELYSTAKLRCVRRLLLTAEADSESKAEEWKAADVPKKPTNQHCKTCDGPTKILSRTLSLYRRGTMSDADMLQQIGGRQSTTDELEKQKSRQSVKDEAGNKDLESIDSERTAAGPQLLEKLTCSPNGLIVAAFVGPDLHFKLLNQVHRQQWRNTLEYQESIVFMPIYFDEDYNYKATVREYNAMLARERRQQAEERSSCDSNCEVVTLDCRALDMSDVDEAIRIGEQLARFNGSIYTKNEKQLQL